MGLASTLYRGELSYDFIGRRRRWYTLSAVLLGISLVGLIWRGFNLGIDFTGGAVFEFEPARATTVTEVTESMEEVVDSEIRVEKIGTGDGSYRVKTKELSPAQVDAVSKQISDDYGVAADSINPTSVSATWGEQITRKALFGLAVFILAVIAYISVTFEPKMAAASIAALFHDITITAGIYAIVGFEVTPSTVIAFLTILGYSLYDNIVVFDKVNENTKGLVGSSRSTYAEAANLSINQTIMRSINTTLTSLLPVASLLFIGVIFLGAGSLKDLSLSLFVGMAAGAYSSVFFATPLLVDMKEREPQYKALAARVASRQSARSGGLATATAGTGPAAVAEESESAGTRPYGARPQARPARPAKKKPAKGRPHGSKKRR